MKMEMMDNTDTWEGDGYICKNDLPCEHIIKNEAGTVKATIPCCGTSEALDMARNMLGRVSKHFNIYAAGKLVAQLWIKDVETTHKPDTRTETMIPCPECRGTGKGIAMRRNKTRTTALNVVHPVLFRDEKTHEEIQWNQFADGSEGVQCFKDEKEISYCDLESLDAIIALGAIENFEDLINNYGKYNEDGDFRIRCWFPGNADVPVDTRTVPPPEQFPIDEDDYPPTGGEM